MGFGAGDSLSVGRFFGLGIGLGTSKSSLSLKLIIRTPPLAYKVL